MAGHSCTSSQFFERDLSVTELNMDPLSLSPTDEGGASQDILQRRRERERNRREQETAEQREERLRKRRQRDRARTAARRSEETEEQREQRFQTRRERDKARRTSIRQQESQESKEATIYAVNIPLNMISRVAAGIVSQMVLWVITSNVTVYACN